MVKAITKGKNGEIEIKNILVAAMAEIENQMFAEGFSVKLHSENVTRCSSIQADKGGSDIVGIPWFSIEVKRNQNLNLLESWWQQCCTQAKEHEMPILFYRQNNRRWHVRWQLWSPEPPYQLIVADTYLPPFLAWFQPWYRQKLQL